MNHIGVPAPPVLYMRRLRPDLSKATQPSPNRRYLSFSVRNRDGYGKMKEQKDPRKLKSVYILGAGGLHERDGVAWPSQTRGARTQSSLHRVSPLMMGIYDDGLIYGMFNLEWVYQGVTPS